MKPRKITAADICEVTGYSRYQLRGLLAELPVYSRQQTVARVAREYTKADMGILAVVHELEARFGVRRESIRSISEVLRQTLVGPKAVNRDARLLISFDPVAVHYLTNELPEKDGILVSLGPIFQRVDDYFGADAAHPSTPQAELNLGPSLVSGGRKESGS